MLQCFSLLSPAKKERKNNKTLLTAQSLHCYHYYQYVRNRANQSAMHSGMTIHPERFLLPGGSHKAPRRPKIQSKIAKPRLRR